MAHTYDVAIISSGHDVADARIHKIVAAMQSRGLNVEVFGLGNADHGPAGARVHAQPRGSMVDRAFRALRLPTRTSARVLFTVDPDVVVPARIAALLRRRAVVADIHEDYTKLLRDRSWARGLAGVVGQAVARAAVATAGGADITVVTDEFVPPRQARRRLVVRNLPSVGMLPPPSPRDERPRAIYIGDLRRSRGLFDMVEVVAAAPQWELDLVGPVAGTDQAELRDRLAVADLADRVRWHGRLPPGPAWKITAGAWVGLLMLHDTPAFREAMPTKLYEYMAAGLAVVTTPLPRQSAIVQESGAGAIVNDPDEAGRVLRDWASDRTALERHAKAAVSWIEREMAGDDPYGRLADAVAELTEAEAAGTDAAP